MYPMIMIRRELEEDCLRERSECSDSFDDFLDGQPNINGAEYHRSEFPQHHITFISNFHDHLQSTTVGSSREVDLDENFRKLPFDEVVSELVKPSDLRTYMTGPGIIKNTFEFYLTPEQIEAIKDSQVPRFDSPKANHMIQVQMRFRLKGEVNQLEDCIPSGVAVRVNDWNCPIPFYSKPLPGYVKKRNVPVKPVDLTSLLKLTSTEKNKVSIVCPPDFGKEYVVGIFLVRKLTSYELVKRMRINNVQDPDFTRERIIEKLHEDAHSDISPTMLRVSLECPLGKMRMVTPARAFSCEHVQCFDLDSYLQMNEFKPTWNCPICNKHAPFEALTVDGYFKEVLASDKLVQGENEIELLPDGSWKVSMTSNQDQNRQGTSREVQVEEIYHGSVRASKRVRSPRGEITDLISRDEENMKRLPFKKRKLFLENEVVVMNLD